MKVYRIFWLRLRFPALKMGLKDAENSDKKKKEEKK